MIGAEWMSAAWGLASAGSWGGGDFYGGLATRDTGVFPAVIGSQRFGVLMLAGAALAFGDQVPIIDNVMWSGAAGLCGSAGLLALYRALAVGRMGLAAPVPIRGGSTWPGCFRRYTPLPLWYWPGSSLHERVTGRQFLGVLAALSAIVMITAR